jgi:hypothetical protein
MLAGSRKRDKEEDPAYACRVKEKKKLCLG